MGSENRVAVFIDFENIKRAVDEYFIDERVDLKRILDEIQRVSDGRITVKRAYGDWGQFRDYRSDLLDNACEPVQLFSLTYRGKNGADIRIAIDVMDVALRQADITHVALVSGDSDFTPLVTKLRESGRVVIGLGVRSNTSNYLAKTCDLFRFYDDLTPNDGGAPPERSVPSTPSDPVTLLASALAALGNRPVPGSSLKTQMRKLDPMFNEANLGHHSFLDFLRSHEDVLDLHKPAIGDVTVGPKGTFGGENGSRSGGNGNGSGISEGGPRHSGYNPYAPPPGMYGGASSTLTPNDRLRLWLRDNNFRYVPCADRQQIIRVMYDIFSEATEEEISLKEAKDRLHQWFEENRPSVPWESVNSTVYHLFYTWCFTFDRTDGDDSKQLWDRRTTLHVEVGSAEEMVARCERGIVRKLWEKERGDLDAGALNAWLYDGADDGLEAVQKLVEEVTSAPGALAGAGYGASRQ